MRLEGNHFLIENILMQARDPMLGKRRQVEGGAQDLPRGGRGVQDPHRADELHADVGGICEHDRH